MGWDRAKSNRKGCCPMAARGIKTRRRRDASNERGAALLEFGVVLPLLLFLILGIVETSWAFSQQNDIRYGSREGARLAAVDWGTAAALSQEICDRMDVVYPSQKPTVTLTPISGGQLGGLAQITVSAPIHTLTGFLDGVLDEIDMKSTIEFRLEQPSAGTAQWWNGGATSVVECT